MNVRQALVAIALIGFASNPALGQADRSTAPAEAESEMGGSGLVLAILAAAAIIAAILIAAGGSDDGPLSA